MEPQSFSFSKKRAHACTVSQEEMRFEGTQVKAPPLLRSPTPLLKSYSSFEEEQARFVVEDQMWSARQRTILQERNRISDGRKMR